MRTALTLGLVAALGVLAGCCGSGGCGVARAPRMHAPPTYGSASGSARAVYERTPSVEVREAARPAGTYVRRAHSFTPPEAPALPATPTVAAHTPSGCEPAPDEGCPGGNCGVPSLDDCCPGGNCAIPSLDSLLDPCKILNPCK